ncbi:unnamed protein product [Boreogadus saida]
MHDDQRHSCDTMWSPGPRRDVGGRQTATFTFQQKSVDFRRHMWLRRHITPTARDELAVALLDVCMTG